MKVMIYLIILNYTFILIIILLLYFVSFYHLSYILIIVFPQEIKKENEKVFKIKKFS